MSKVQKCKDSGIDIRGYFTLPLSVEFFKTVVTGMILGQQNPMNAVECIQINTSQVA